MAICHKVTVHHIHLIQTDNKTAFQSKADQPPTGYTNKLIAPVTLTSTR